MGNDSFEIFRFIEYFWELVIYYICFNNKVIGILIINKEFGKVVVEYFLCKKVVKNGFCEVVLKGCKYIIVLFIYC